MKKKFEILMVACLFISAFLLARASAASAIFIVLPEEDQTKYFMVSLILQNLYRS
jgi:hypothetical protein